MRFIIPIFILQLMFGAIYCKGGGHCCGPDGCNYWCMYDYGPQDGYCDAIYYPGGPTIHIEPIEAPVAELKESSMSHFAKELGFSVTIVGQGLDVIKFTEDVAEFAGNLAKGLGIMGTLFGALGSVLTPTPADIIDAVNKALDQLTDEINGQFNNMVEYVDQSIRQAQADALKNLNSYFSAKFSNCLYEVIEEKFYQCLDEAEREIHAASTFFMQFKAKMGGTYEFTAADIKKMEVEFLTFMDYGMLRTINLLVMGASYYNMSGENGRLQTCRFLLNMHSETQEFLDYTQFIYNSISTGHYHDDAFLRGTDATTWSHDCEDINESWVWTRTRCWCRYKFSSMLVDSDDYRCRQRTDLRRDEDCPDNSPADCKLMSKTECTNCDDPVTAIRYQGYKLLLPRFHNYTQMILTSVKNYWEPQTTNKTTLWRELHNEVTKPIDNLQCDTANYSLITSLTVEERKNLENAKTAYVAEKEKRQSKKKIEL